MNAKKKLLSNLGFLAVVMAIIGSFAIYAAYFSNGDVDATDLTAGPTHFTPDLESFKHITIVENFENTVTHDNIVSAKGQSDLRITGHIGSGYVVVKADVDGDPLRHEDPHNFDTVYVSLVDLESGVENGGHLWEDQTLVPEFAETDDHTMLMYRLDQVFFKKHYLDGDDETSFGDWQWFLDIHNHVRVVYLNSTTKGMGTLRELTIYYTCRTEEPCSIDFDNFE